jgi:hypothetical protein
MADDMTLDYFNCHFVLVPCARSHIIAVLVLEGWGLLRASFFVLFASEDGWLAGFAGESFSVSLCTYVCAFCVHVQEFHHQPTKNQELPVDWPQWGPQRSADERHQFEKATHRRSGNDILTYW